MKTLCHLFVHFHFGRQTRVQTERGKQCGRVTSLRTGRVPGCHWVLGGQAPAPTHQRALCVIINWSLLFT